MTRPAVGVSWMPQPGFRAAVEPWLDAVEVVEWTVDAGFGRALPPSTEAVLAAYGAAGRLYGHGTGYSPLSAGRDDRAAAWLDALALDTRRHRYRALSEHFGWCTGGRFAFSAPLPLPRTPEALDVGRERLRRLAAVSGVPIGLENLALAFSADDALAQGPFVAELLEPVDGYVHLDLHNLWCPIANFGLDPERLLATWPLDRVRVVHVSGGTWVDGLRRDTHDDRVPDEVWSLLRRVLPRIPRCEAVILERIGTAFATGNDRETFANDWVRLVSEVTGGS